MDVGNGSNSEGTVEVPPSGRVGEAIHAPPIKTPEKQQARACQHPQTLPLTQSPQGLEPVTGAAWAGWWPWREQVTQK